MFHIKTTLVISLVMVLSFFCGYRGDRLRDFAHNTPLYLKNLFNHTSSPESVAAPGRSTSAANSPLPASPIQPPGVTPDGPRLPTANGAPPPIGSKVSPSLRSAMDAVRPGAETDSQIQQRNLYFEKLSQQLNELKGDAPPSTLPPVPDSGQGPPAVPNNLAPRPELFSPPPPPPPAAAPAAHAEINDADENDDTSVAADDDEDDSDTDETADDEPDDNE